MEERHQFRNNAGEFEGHAVLLVYGSREMLEQQISVLKYYLNIEEALGEELKRQQAEINFPFATWSNFNYQSRESMPLSTGEKNLEPEKKQKQKPELKKQEKPVTRQKPVKKRQKFQTQSSESYKPDEEEEFALERATTCRESKNVPKIFSNAILTFIGKNESYARRVLANLEISPGEFYDSLQKVRNRLETIHQLRAFWSDAENRFAKAHRIMSMEFLKKHSLGHIFNSRVNHFQKHLKYRQKMMEAVRNPSGFTCLKDF